MLNNNPINWPKTIVLIVIFGIVVPYVVISYIDGARGVSVEKIKEWDHVAVDYQRAREDVQNRRSHFVYGTDTEIVYDHFYQSLTLISKDGYRMADVKETAGDLFAVFTWKVDCQNGRFTLRHALAKTEWSDWSAISAGTKAAALSTNICKLPAKHSLF